MSKSQSQSSASQSKSQNFDHLFKIVLVGDSGVGKSNLLSRYTRNTFCAEEKSTIGVEFATRILTLDDGKRVKAQIWDTAGQERYRAISNAYYRGAVGAMLVFDMNDSRTLDNIPRWLSELKDHANRDIVLFLVGAKSDLCGMGTNQVSEEAAEAMAKRFGIRYIVTSALTGAGVEAAFVNLIKDIYKALGSKLDTRKDANGKLNLSEQQKSSSEKKCCK